MFVIYDKFYNINKGKLIIFVVSYQILKIKLKAMFANFENDRQTLPNENKKLAHDRFTKSMASFNTKKTFSKNQTQQNSTKKAGPLKQEKSKTKRVYLSR